MISWICVIVGFFFPIALSYLLNLITSFVSFPVKFTSESAE